MKKKLIYGAFIFVTIFILNLLFDFLNQSTASVGIIGGADGPTAIFLAKEAGPSRAGFFGILFLVVIVIILFMKKFHKK